MPRFSKWFLPSRFSDFSFVRISHLSHACYILWPSYLSSHIFTLPFPKAGISLALSLTPYIMPCACFLNVCKFRKPTAKTGGRTLYLGHALYEGVSKSFRTGRLERELQMVQLPATKCSCIAIL